MYKIRPSLIKYIENSIIPQYKGFDSAHQESHVNDVIQQALELAKQNLAGQIQTEVTALIENTVANEQMDADEAASITRSVLASKNLISQSLGRTIPVVEVFRVLP